MARCWLDFHDPDKTVFLAGCGRSGTTWLGDLMNYRNRYRVMFEPFFRREVPELGGRWNPVLYVRPGEPAHPAAAVIDRILAGRIVNPWIDQFNRRRMAAHRLIKDIRANYLLGWIRAHHPAIPLFFILRHPIPTVLSQVKLGWPTDMNRFLDQPDLMADHLEPFREWIRETDEFESRLTIWCLLNWVPLRQFASGGLTILFYEDFCRRPEEVLPPLLRAIGEEYRPWILNTIQVPSRLSQGSSAIVKGEDPVESWRDKVTPDQMRTALTVLKRFGLDRIYGEESLPRVKPEDVCALFR